MDAKALPLGHNDFVHDIAYDYYGQRLATCSADRMVKVFDLAHDPLLDTESKNSWLENDSWKASDSGILVVKWAHPEFGQVIVTASMDRTVRIWEEQKHEPKKSSKRWVERARLADSRAPVFAVEFAPVHHGLQLATLAADAQLRIYEALESSNLSSWTLMHEFPVLSLQNANLPEHPTAISSSKQDFSSPVRSLSGVSVSKLGNTLQLANSSSQIFSSAPNSISGSPAEGSNLQAYAKSASFTSVLANALRKTETSFCLTYCPAKSQGLQIAIGGMETARIWKFNSQKNQWIGGEELTGHSDLVLDIAWANSMGRSYQLIATACADGHVRIFKLTEAERLDYLEDEVINYQVELLADMPDHNAPVRRVSFNFIGTILSSAGDDGNIRLWKSSYTHSFQCMAIMSLELKEDNDMNDETNQDH